MNTIDCFCVAGSPGGGGAGELVSLMDAGGVDAAVLHPSDRGYAFHNEEENDALLKAASVQRGRLFASATVSPWRDGAWEIVERSLDRGAAMLSFSPGVQGFNPAGDALRPILDKLSCRGPGIPVYIRTGHHCFGSPTQVLMLANIYPDLNFIMGHSGSTDYAGDVDYVLSISKNVFAETSFARPPAVCARVEKLGGDRIIMGSGWPCNFFDFEWSEMRRLLPPGHAGRVLGGNLAKLIKEKT